MLNISTDAIGPARAKTESLPFLPLMFDGLSISPLKMKRWTQSLLLLVGLAGVAGCTTPPLLYPEPIKVSSSLRQALFEYEKRPLQKAFAGGSDGAYGYGYLGDEPNRVVRTALSNCQKHSTRSCRVLDISGEPFQDAYLKFSIESKKALDEMKVPAAVSYHFETLDWQMSFPTRLRTQAEGYHAPTPLTLPGIKTITTAELARALKQGRIKLIEARGWGDVPIQTIPNAHLIDWAGTEESDIDGREETLRRNFSRVMQLIQPDKTQPVALSCFSAECWLSVNAVLRLQAMGYTNLHWYRGGIEAWTAAKLPTVTAVPHATIWSE